MHSPPAPLRWRSALRRWITAGALGGTTFWAAAQTAAPGKPVPVEDFFAPYGAVQAAIAPDGRHVALIEHWGLRYSLRLVALADLSQRVLVRGEWARDGFYLLNKQPQRVTWVNSDTLAVDMGAVAEALDLNGKKVADLGTSIIGKAVPDDPDSPLMLVHDDLDRATVAMVDVRSRRSQRLKLPMAGEPQHWTFDEKGQLRAVVVAESSFWRDNTPLHQWYRPVGQTDWVKLSSHRVTDDNWTALAAFSDRDELLVASRHGRDRLAIFKYRPLNGPIEQAVPVLADEQADIAPGENPRAGTARSFFALGLKPQRHWLNQDWRTVQTAVDEVLPGRINQLSGNPAGQVLIHSYSDLDPGRWLLLDVPKAEMRLLALHRQRIQPERMQPMETYRYQSLDGLSIPAFLTRPASVSTQPQPTVVLVHGGPAVRDHWGWDPEVQLLASRGYVVFQPQFRGSTGFGKAFEEAGHGQWGRAMQDDITAGVQDLVRRGIADPRRICIVGASYGGYAAVWGLVKTPDLYRCGVSLAGVSDIGHLLTDWSDTNSSPMGRELMRRLVGAQQRTPAEFDEVSPLKHAARIQAPVLIAHGDDDLRVPISHARKLRSALDRAGKPYEWLLLRDEGHGMQFVHSQVTYYQTLLAFLARHLKPEPADRPSGGSQNKP